MKARRRIDGIIVNVSKHHYSANNGEDIFVDDNTNMAYTASDLDFSFSEPEEEVTIDGRIEHCIDGKVRLYTGYINYLYLPSDCKIEGEVTITIKPKKK